VHSEKAVDDLAQTLRREYVMTQIGRSGIGFTMAPWSGLTSREKAPYIAQAVAAFRYFDTTPYASMTAATPDPRRHTWDAIDNLCVVCGLPMTEAELTADCPEPDGATPKAETTKPTPAYDDDDSTAQAIILLENEIALGRRCGMAGQTLGAMCTARDELAWLRDVIQATKNEGDAARVAAALKILTKVPDVPPDEGDELPEGGTR